jgi:hypothetical protein
MKLNEIKFRSPFRIAGQVREGVSMTSNYDKPTFAGLELIRSLRAVAVTLKKDGGALLVPIENVAFMLPAEWPPADLVPEVKKKP